MPKKESKPIYLYCFLPNLLFNKLNQQIFKGYQQFLIEYRQFSRSYQQFLELYQQIFLGYQQNKKRPRDCGLILTFHVAGLQKKGLLCLIKCLRVYYRSQGYTRQTPFP